MGYSVLFAPNMERALQLYHIFHDLVKSVISFPSQVSDCWDNAECVRTSENPSGIPAWKLFSFYFWHEAPNPLGAKWTLNPEDVSNIPLYSVFDFTSPRSISFRGMPRITISATASNLSATSIRSFRTHSGSRRHTFSRNG